MAGPSPGASAPGEDSRPRAATGSIGAVALLSLALLLVSLSLGTAPLELATGLAVVVGLAVGERRALPLLAPALAVVALLLASALGGGGRELVEALGRAWPLAPLLAVPMLVPRLNPAQLERLVQLGLAAALVPVVWAAVELLRVGALPWAHPAQGPFSHHLTYGYALLPPIAVALYRRSWLALPLALGVGLAGSSGPLLALVVVATAVWWRPLPALVGGAAAALVLIGLLHGQTELDQRVVLWESGVMVAVGQPLGAGPLGVREALGVAQEALRPGFYFPLHAHDTMLQAAAMAGPAMWLCWAWLGVSLWRHTGRAGQAALAALVVGGTTQDTLGDLEVVRALLVWATLLPLELGGPPTAPLPLGTDPPPPTSNPSR
jgi:hypothetical protein